MAKNKFLPFMLIVSAVILLLFLIMQPVTIMRFQDQISVLFPKGKIAFEQRNLLFIIQAIMLLVIVPVYILTFIFSWRYNKFHPKEKYDPDLIDNTLAEYIWWGIPCILTLIIAVLTWEASYRLDPFKPIQSDKKPLHIQVVALQWKWLFIYPEEKIATVNYIQFPKEVPLHFEITADAPMNSFWIPHLGGQIYAMPKMRSELNLIANEEGEFRGSSANLSGEGFAGMTFIAQASSAHKYQEWLEKAQKTTKALGRKEYDQLALPSSYNPEEIFLLQERDLFDQVIKKYMEP